MSNRSCFKVLCDTVALAYHEARNVRHLTKAKLVDQQPWRFLISLPNNRVDAWREIVPVEPNQRKPFPLTRRSGYSKDIFTYRCKILHTCIRMGIGATPDLTAEMPGRGLRNSRLNLQMHSDLRMKWPRRKSWRNFRPFGTTTVC